MVNEGIAEQIRRLNPKRVEYAWWSDENPFLTWLPGAAENARKNRKPVSRDNPFLALQTAMSRVIVSQLEAVQEARDRYSEALFKALYDSPWVQAIAGMRAAEAERSVRREHDPAYDILVKDRARALRARIQEGGALEGIARMLIYLAMADHLADHRGFRYLQSIRKRYPRAAALNREQIKALVRDQTAMLRLDEEGALTALRVMLPDPREREEAMKLVAEVARMRGDMTETCMAHLNRLEGLLIEPDGPVARQH